MSLIVYHSALFFFFLTLEKTWILKRKHLTHLSGLRWEHCSGHLKSLAINSSVGVGPIFAGAGTHLKVSQLYTLSQICPPVYTSTRAPHPETPQATPPPSERHIPYIFPGYVPYISLACFLIYGVKSRSEHDRSQIVPLSA